MHQAHLRKLLSWLIYLDLNLYFKCPISHFYQLALRTVSSSRSAYACFLFNESFFISYDDGSSDVPAGSQEEDLFKCKIAMKVSGITCTTKLTIKLLQERPDFLSPWAFGQMSTVGKKGSKPGNQVSRLLTHS